MKFGFRPSIDSVESVLIPEPSDKPKSPFYNSLREFFSSVFPDQDFTGSKKQLLFETVACFLRVFIRRTLVARNDQPPQILSPAFKCIIEQSRKLFGQSQVRAPF